MSTLCYLTTLFEMKDSPVKLMTSVLFSKKAEPKNNDKDEITGSPYRNNM